jgi:hypothetical protein
MLREPAPPIPTLARLRRHQCWVWIICSRWGCLRRAPMPLAPAIIRWGPDASSDVLRQRVRYSGCGSATLQIPSWVGSEIGLAPFPDAVTL